MPTSAWHGMLDTRAQPPSSLPRVQPAPIGGRPAEYQTTDWSVLHSREPTLMSEAARQQVASTYPFQVSTGMPGLFRDSPVVAGTHVAVPTVHANLGLTGGAGAPVGATPQVGGPGMGAYVPWDPRPAAPLGQARGLPEGGTHYLGASSAGQQPRGVTYSSTFRGEPVHKLMTQIRTRLGMRLDDGVPVFGGTAPGQTISHRTNAVLFAEHFSSVMSQFCEGSWRLPADTWDQSLGVWRPMPDVLTPKRVELLMTVIAHELSTRATMSAEEPVEVPTISGPRVTLAKSEVTATQWLRLLVAECSRDSLAKGVARQYLKGLARGQGESDMALARRLCLASRAATVDPDHPHIQEEHFFWRYITAEHLDDMCRQVMTVLMPSLTHQMLMDSHMLLVSNDIQDRLSRLVITYNDPMHPTMVARGLLTRKAFDQHVRKLSVHIGRQAAAAFQVGKGNAKSPMATLDGVLAMAQTSRVSAIQEEETLAAVVNKRASTPGKGGVPFVAKRGRFASTTDESRRKAKWVAPGTPSEETPTAAARTPQRATRSSPPGAQHTASRPPVEIPPPDANRETAVDFIHRARICFRHARGLPCKRRRCIWSHADEDLPAGYFAEVLREPDEAQSAAQAAVAAMGREELTQEDWDDLVMARWEREESPEAQDEEGSLENHQC